MRTNVLKEDPGLTPALRRQVELDLLLARDDAVMPIAPFAGLMETTAEGSSRWFSVDFIASMAMRW